MAEKIWLVDGWDRPSGEGWQERSYTEGVNWKNFRSVAGFIRNEEGKIWMPFRTPNKPIFASMFDASISGAVAYRESYEEAFRREASEETGLNIDDHPVSFLLYLNPQELDISSWTKVWEIRANEVPSYNRDDYSSAYWMSPEEVQEHVDIGARFKPDVLALFNLLYPLSCL